MPLYDYKCNSCEHTFSEIHKIDDRHVPVGKPCPECQSENSIEQCIGAPTPVCPIRLGRVQPSGEFKDRVKQIKTAHKYVKNNIKDY